MAAVLVCVVPLYHQPQQAAISKWEFVAMDKSYSARLKNTALEKFRAHLDSFPMSFFGKGAYGRCKAAPPPENMFSYNTVLTVKNEPFRLHYIYTDRNRGDTVARITAALFRNDELHINIAWDAESSETYIGNRIFSIKHFWKDALIDPSGSTEANTQQRAAPQTDRPESNMTNHVFTTPVSPERFVAWITGKCNAYPFSFGWIDDSTDTDTAMCFSRLAPDCKRRGPDYILTWFVGVTRGDMYRGERESIIFRVCELLTEPVTSKIVAECVFDPALNYFGRLLDECGQSIPENEATEMATPSDDEIERWADRETQRGMKIGTAERVTEFHRLLKSGYSQRLAKKSVRCDPSTYYQWCKEVTGEDPIEPYR
jgi:hypothetical protein